MNYVIRWWFIGMSEKLIQNGNPTNMLWRLFRLAVEEEEIPEETDREMRFFISRLPIQENG